MNPRIELLTMIAILGACTDHGGESSVEPPEVPSEASATKAGPVEATPTSGTTPDESPTEIEAPRPPPPTELHVAAEGRCRYMKTSLVQGKAFLHYSGGPIVQLDAEGTPTGIALDTKVARAKDSPQFWDDHLHQIDHVGGRPDQLFAEVYTDGREGIRGLYRRTANTWEPVTVFGDDASADRMYNWFDGSLLAFSGSVGSTRAKFAVVRGKPKGPRFDRAMAKTGCSEVDIEQILVLERGDVVALWTCDEHDTFVTHWRKGDLAGNTQDLGGDGAFYNDRLDPRTIATDESDGYYVVAGTPAGKQKLWHGKDAQWKQLDLPKGAGVFQMATDPAGRLWIAGTKLARRDGESWTEIAMPDGKPIAELAGVQYGTPWVRNGIPPGDYRTGGRIWRIADDKATEIVVPHSAFFEDEKLRIERMHFVGPDDMWADADFVVQRHGKGKPGRYYHSVLRSKPTKHPLRCGELIDGKEMKQAFVPWPTAAGGTCKKRLALLMRRSSWDDTNDYPKFKKALKSVEGLAAVRFVELELGQEKFFTAITQEAALVATIQKKIKKLRPYTYPEVVCGDDAVLEHAGVVVHREVSFAAD